MRRPPGITSIQFAKGLGSTPAKVLKSTGEVFINPTFWNKLPAEHRLFILLHEQGHLVRATDDEFKADEYAFNEYAKLGYSLSESVRALSQVLNGQNPEHYWRICKQFERAAAYDAHHNKNFRAMSYLVDEANFIGKGARKRRQQKRAWKQHKKEARFENRMYKKGSQTDRKNHRTDSKAYKRMTRADSRILRSEGKRFRGQSHQTLAQQGISKTTGFGEIGGGIVNAAVKFAPGAAQMTDAAFGPQEAVGRIPNPGMATAVEMNGGYSVGRQAAPVSEETSKKGIPMGAIIIGGLLFVGLTIGAIFAFKN